MIDSEGLSLVLEQLVPRQRAVAPESARAYSGDWRQSDGLFLVGHYETNCSGFLVMQYLTMIISIEMIICGHQVLRVITVGVVNGSIHISEKPPPSSSLAMCRAAALTSLAES